MRKLPLVALGDSLTQGFMSAAVSRTDISYPALIARALKVQDFRNPDFSGAGGLPLNLEFLIGEISKICGPKIRWWQIPGVLGRVRKMMDRLEDYWERGDGQIPLPGGLPPHNLGLWGFRLQDSLNVTAATWDGEKSTRDNFLNQLPDQPLYRSVRRVLQPENLPPVLTQWESVKILSAFSGLENLIFMLGANNVLGTVIDLVLRETKEGDEDLLPHQRQDNLASPKQFTKLYERLIPKVKESSAQRVFVGTIPHVTIPPITRGTGSQDSQGYYEFYTRPWIWDSVFDPGRHPHLPRTDIKKIDQFVDEYNFTIKKTASLQGWHVVDISALLDSLAFRRNFGQTGFHWPMAAVEALKASPDTSYLIKEGKPTLDSRFFASEKGRVVKGGLFSLDGVHPTTICYGLMAQSFLDVMSKEGVRTREGEIPVLDWPGIVREDSLVRNPPALLENLKETLNFLADNRILQPLLKLAGGRVV